MLDVQYSTATMITVTAGGDLPSGMSKSLSANWSAGENSGGLDIGSLQAGLDYHVHLITSDTADIIVSRSPHNPLLPDNYTLYGYLGSFITKSGAAEVEPFTRCGATVELLEIRVPVSNISMAAPYYPNTGRITLPVPKGFKTRSELSILAQTSSNNSWVAVWDADLGLKPPTVYDSSYHLRQYRLGGVQTGFSCASQADNGGNIYWRDTDATAGYLFLRGWTETRTCDPAFYICCAGTSLTDPAGRWEAALQRRLNAISNKPVYVRGLGEGGVDSGYWVTNIDRIIAQRPHVVLLETSMNDALHAIGVSTAASNIASIVGSIQSALPETSIFLMTMNWCGRANASLNTTLAGYYQNYRDTYSGLSVELIDNAADWPSTSIPDSYFQEYLVGNSGGMHPTPEINDSIMNPNIVEALEGLL